MPPATRVIVLDFDGTCYRGDLPVQAYARRIAESLDSASAALMIAGMRAFLEAKPPPDGLPAEFTFAEDGYELIGAVADAAGVPESVRQQAYRQSREDVARSAFALDPEPALMDFLTGVRPAASVWLVTSAPAVGIAEVLDSVGLSPLIDEVHSSASKPDGLRTIAERAVHLVQEPARLLAVGDRWGADLEPVHAVGGRTALIDRFGRGRGTPSWRARTIDGLLPLLQDWAADLEGVSVAR